MKLASMLTIAAISAALTGIGSLLGVDVNDASSSDSQAGVMGGGGVVVTLTPSQATLSPGATLQLTVTLTSPGGNPVKSKAPISWTSSNVNFATVSAAGLVTAVGAGSATITAMSAGSSGTATIVVANPTCEVDVTVLDNDPDHSVIPGATVSLTYSGNPTPVTGTTDGDGTAFFLNQPINIPVTIDVVVNDGSGKTATGFSSGFVAGVNSVTLVVQ